MSTKAFATKLALTRYLEAVIWLSKLLNVTEDVWNNSWNENFAFKTAYLSMTMIGCSTMSCYS